MGQETLCHVTLQYDQGSEELCGGHMTRRLTLTSTSLFSLGQRGGVLRVPGRENVVTLALHPLRTLEGP